MSLFEQRVFGTAALLVLAFWVMAGLNLCGITSLHWMLVTAPLWVPATIWGCIVLASIVLFYFDTEGTD